MRGSSRYLDLRVDKTDIKKTIYEHPEFTAFIDGMNRRYDPHVPAGRAARTDVFVPRRVRTVDRPPKHDKHGTFEEKFRGKLRGKLRGKSSNCLGHIAKSLSLKSPRKSGEQNELLNDS